MFDTELKLKIVPIPNESLIGMYLELKLKMEKFETREENIDYIRDVLTRPNSNFYIAFQTLNKSQCVVMLVKKNIIWSMFPICSIDRNIVESFGMGDGDSIEIVDYSFDGNFAIFTLFWGTHPTNVELNKEIIEASLHPRRIRKWLENNFTTDDLFLID